MKFIRHLPSNSTAIQYRMINSYSIKNPNTFPAEDRLLQLIRHPGYFLYYNKKINLEKSNGLFFKGVGGLN